MNETIRTLHLKSSIFWDITSCSQLKMNRRFGGSCRIHIQGRRISQARNQREARSYLLILRPWRWRWHVPPKRRLTFNWLHGVISQKRELFITTTVRTSNLTPCGYVDTCILTFPEGLMYTKKNLTQDIRPYACRAKPRMPIVRSEALLIIWRDQLVSYSACLLPNQSVNSLISQFASYLWNVKRATCALQTSLWLFKYRIEVYRF
jgi:hypothetical protein